MFFLAVSAPAQDVATRLGALRHARVCTSTALEPFYARRAFAPAWDEQNAAAMSRAIEHASDDALEPSDYHQQELRNASGVDRDILLSDAFLVLASDLVRGRVDPETLDPLWCLAPRNVDIAAVLQAALDVHDVGASLAALAPRHEQYRQLRAAYQVMRAMNDWPPIERGPALIAQLRARFALPASNESDAALDAAIRELQLHHGLAVDGVVGPKTLAELNVPRSARLEQLAVNMERWRWMPDALGERHILVNVAAFQLQLVEGGKVALSMKIVAGKQLTTTPFFPAKVERIILNPAWNVPPNIEHELWAKQRRDGDYFAREHIRVVAGGGLRQDPGPWCALGRIKFDMPNRFTVYLHDTPAKSLFSGDLRAFSHGCIRLEKPFELAAALLGHDVTVTDQVQRTIALTPPVPVYILYWTAFVADDGDIEFRRDVYDRDPALAAALRRRSVSQLTFAR